MTPECKARILEKMSDHNTISLELSLNHRPQEQREIRPRYLRDLSDKLLDETRSQIKAIQDNAQLSHLERFEHFETLMSILNKEHLEIKPEPPKAQIPFRVVKMKKALANVEKLIRNLEQLDRNDKDGIRYVRTASEQPAVGKECTALDNAARRLHKMRTRHAEHLDTTAPTTSSPKKWIRDLQKRAEGLRRKIQHENKRNERTKIRKHIERLINAHQSDPKTFWRKMKPQGQTKSLSAVEIEETVQDPVSGNPVTTKRSFAADADVIREVAKFQTEVFASKGEVDTAAFLRNWRPAAPNTTDDQVRQKAERTPEPKEVSEAIKQAAKGKSTGTDNTAVETLAQLIGNEQNSPTLAILHNLIVELWNDGPLPESWRTGQMILLYKDGSESAIGNYRPITLLQASYKLYSHILCSRATEFLEARAVLSPAQYGFRAGRSTAHALFATTEAINTALKTNTELHVLYIDFKKAFDSIEHDILDAVIDESFYGIPPKLAEALKQTYRNRRIVMKLEQGTSDPFPIGRGVPQGDPLSPLLFILAINPLLQALERMQGASIHGINYAVGAFCDDLTLLANRNEDITALWEKLLAFSRDTLLFVNARKTDYSTNRNVPIQNHANLNFDGTLIVHVDGNTPIRSLGLQITLNGDQNAQKSKTSGLLQADLQRLKRKAISDGQFLDVLKKMVLPKLAYSFGHTTYTKDELKALQSRLEMAIIRRLRLPDRYYSDWIQMDVKLGGLGVPSVQTIYACQKAATLLQIVRGPESAPLRILLAQLRRDNLPQQGIYINDAKSLWSQANSELATFGAQIQTRNIYSGWASLATEISQNGPLAPLVKLLPENTPPRPILDLFFQYAPDTAEPTLEQKPIHVINELLTASAQKADPNAMGPQMINPTQIRALKDALDRHTALNNTSRSTPNKVHDISPLHNKSLLEITIADRRFHKDGSLTPEPGTTTYAKVIFTDGSQKDGKASYGISRTEKPNFPAERYSGRVDGRQTNHRGELTAILGVLSSIQGPLSQHRFHHANDLADLCSLVIATDSEGSIKSTLGFRTKNKTEQMKTPDRDVILDILHHMDRITLNRCAAKVLFLHVPAHTADSPDNNNPHLKGRRQVFVNMIGNKTLAEKLIQGNKRADEAAETGRTKGAQINRDWHKTPTPTVDPIYVTQKTSAAPSPSDTIHNTIAALLGEMELETNDDDDERPNAGPDKQPKRELIDGSIHKFIKSQAQISAVNNRAAKKNQKRNIYLKELPKCDKKLSFPALAGADPKTHRTAIHLFKMRMYSLDSMKKPHRKGNAGNKEKTLMHNYYQRLYPDEKCHACDRFLFLNPDPNTTAPSEDTEHMIDCENVPGKSALFDDLWNDIKTRLRQYKKAKPQNIAKLFPFASSSSAMRNASPPVDAAALPALAAVRAATPAMCRAVLVPKELTAALRECGLSREQARKEAGLISLNVQEAALAAFRLRCHQLASDRGQRRVYKEEVTDKLRKAASTKTNSAVPVALVERPNAPPNKRFHRPPAPSRLLPNQRQYNDYG
jgi:ribonuclease HI